MPGLPTDSWINGIEASRFVAGRLYVAANNYRNDDYANYLYTLRRLWCRAGRALAVTLQANRVVRTIREDPRNPDALYLGTEFGAFFSPDRGTTWIELCASACPPWP